eukprot:scaffold227289_cov20-Tisochrysis_lutea.AAC.1
MPKYCKIGSDVNLKVSIYPYSEASRNAAKKKAREVYEKGGLEYMLDCFKNGFPGTTNPRVRKTNFGTWDNNIYVRVVDNDDCMIWENPAFVYLKGDGQEGQE